MISNKHILILVESAEMFKKLMKDSLPSFQNHVLYLKNKFCPLVFSTNLSKFRIKA